MRERANISGPDSWSFQSHRNPTRKPPETQALIQLSCSATTGAAAACSRMSMYSSVNGFLRKVVHR